ncbi:hypothetical protein [Streptomyces sp. NPDC059452]|uniref:hypothetical protein n=1 Tax=Streptomyces sp. NPDC059452 TaxID=3346835 RepID=UPI00369E548E
MASRTGSGSGSRAYRQLLLLAALLFGIVTMHTVGHPAEHAPSASVSGATGQEAVTMPVADADAVSAFVANAVTMPVADAVASAVDGAVTVGSVASGVGHPSHGSPGDAPMSGMDPLSVCLAVLGAWGLALVGAWMLGLRADGRGIGTPVGAGLLRVLRPNPPPRISVLASVSVLRI